MVFTNNVFNLSNFNEQKWPSHEREDLEQIGQNDLRSVPPNKKNTKINTNNWNRKQS